MTEQTARQLELQTIYDATNSITRLKRLMEKRRETALDVEIARAHDAIFRLDVALARLDE